MRSFGAELLAIISTEGRSGNQLVEDFGKGITLQTLLDDLRIEENMLARVPTTTHLSRPKVIGGAGRAEELDEVAVQYGLRHDRIL